jgi:hypothetical protein
MTDEKDWTMPVPVAGKKYYGLGRSASYQAAATGELPVVRIGGKVLAVVRAIEARLSQAGAKTTAQ